MVLIGGLVIGLVAPELSRAEDTPRDTPARIEDIRGLRVFTDELHSAVERARSFSAVVRALQRREEDLDRERLIGEHQQRLAADLEALDEARRLAITALEAFVAEHHTDPDLTPDALLRLAVLLHEDANDRSTDELERWTALLERQRAGETIDLPPEPVTDTSRCIDLTRMIVRDFSEYRHIDAALYLLGICLGEAGEIEEARSAFQHLVCSSRFQYHGPPAPGTAPAAPSTRPPGRFVDPYSSCTPVVEGSRFATEVWFRIGESHFDYDLSSEGLDLAIAAYRNAVRDRSSRVYAITVYKLAWSFYRASRYPEAIEHFVAVATLADEPGGRHRSQVSLVRREAITYLGFCFAGDDWDIDGRPDAVRGIDRLQDPTLLPQDLEFTREVYVATAEISYNLARYADAIEVYELILRRWPLALEAPRLLEGIAAAYNRDSRWDDASTAHERVIDYGPGSEWQNAHAAAHPDVVADVNMLIRNVLYDTAVLHHQRAQQLREAAIVTRSDEQLRRAIEEFGRAAEGYRTFLGRYPLDPDVYEMTFNMAEAFFFSGQYREAADAYARVRDSLLDGRFRDDAARRAARSLELLREDEARDGGEGGDNDAP
jgi:tetratricopeptide (TPR) repeat protein